MSLPPWRPAGLEGAAGPGGALAASEGATEQAMLLQQQAQLWQQQQQQQHYWQGPEVQHGAEVGEDYYYDGGAAEDGVGDADC